MVWYGTTNLLVPSLLHDDPIQERNQRFFRKGELKESHMGHCIWCDMTREIYLFHQFCTVTPFKWEIKGFSARANWRNLIWDIVYGVIWHDKFTSSISFARWPHSSEKSMVFLQGRIEGGLCETLYLVWYDTTNLIVPSVLHDDPIQVRNQRFFRKGELKESYMGHCIWCDMTRQIY